MPALAITANQVLPGADAVVVDGTAGATVTAGMVAYRDPTTRKLLGADSDSATAAVRTPEGIFLNGAADGQPVRMQTGGSITLGAAAAMTVGKVYVLGYAAGAIAPSTDLASGWYVGVIGVATTASVLKMGILASGVATP